MAFLQAGFGEFLGSDLLGSLRTLGWQGIRLEQGNTMDDTALLTMEVREAGLEALVIVFRPEHVPVVLDQGGMVEVENEPLIAYPNRRFPREAMKVEDYITFARDCLTSAGDVMIGQLWLGAVHTLNPECLRYLDDIATVVEGDYGISYHRYTNGQDMMNPQPGMDSRESEMEELTSIARGRPLARTECGRHTAPDSRSYGVFNLRKETWQLTDDEVARDNAEEIALDVGWGVQFTTIYQLNDGPDPAVALDRYGIRRSDGTWKPSASRTT
jgi:hypothetical protein